MLKGKAALEIQSSDCRRTGSETSLLKEACRAPVQLSCLCVCAHIGAHTRAPVHTSVYLRSVCSLQCKMQLNSVEWDWIVLRVTEL